MLDASKIWNSSNLPTLPSVAVKLLELTRNPETEINEIVRLIKTDPAICGKVLKSTNSSFFGFSSQVTSIDRAIPLLGTTVVTSLALSFSLASDSVTSGPMQDYYRSYWRQSIVHAVAGETIGKRIGRGLECEYFLAGLMLDIGRLAMLKTVSRDYYSVILTAEEQKRPLHEVEQEFLGFDHVKISYQLLESWKLPASLLNGVKFQHASLEELEKSLQPEKHTFEAAMVLANAVGDYFASSACGIALQRIRWIAGRFFKMDPQEIEKFLGSLQERLDQAGDLFSVDMSDITDTSELMAQANQQLLQLTMQAHAENAQIAARQKKIEQEKEDLLSQNEVLQEKVTRDALTGVYNRAYFDTALQKAMWDAQDRCVPISVIFTDIDKFKRLNDTYGHQFGDEVLKRFAAVVSQNLRSTDVFARYGGEEFVILVNRPTENGVEKLMERIRSMVEQEVFEHSGESLHMTASFGGAIVLPGRRQHNSSEYLIQQADEAMYDSKKNGRNQVHLRSLITIDERDLLKAINQAKFTRWLVNQEIMEIPAVSRLLLQISPDSRPLGKLAFDMGLLSEMQIRDLVRLQQLNRDRRFGELAVEAGFFTMIEMIYLLSWQTEPPQKLVSALAASGAFSLEQSQELFEQYVQSSPMAERSISLCG